MKSIIFKNLFEIPLRNGLTKPKKVRGSGYKMVNMGELFAYPIIKNIDMDRVPLKEQEKITFLKKGDLLFARQSLAWSGAGQCSIFWGDEEDVCFESHLIRCRLNSKLANPLFYFYFFRSVQGRNIMERIIEQGAGASGIRSSDLSELEIPLFDLNEQNKISKILYELDEKIGLNTQINQTLETIAQVIFKSWFVDFDPIYAKINAIENDEDPTLAAMQTISCKNSEELDRLQTENPQEYRKLEELANAFPSEIGDDSVPKGWESRELSGLFEFIGGSQPPKTQHIYEEKEGYERFIQNRDFSSENHKTYIPISKRNKRCTEKDILMDKYGDAGRVRFGISGAYNVALARINPINSNLREFLRWYFSQDKIRNYLNASSMASTRNSLNSTSFTALEVVVPSDVILNHFETIIDVHVSKVLQIKEENRNLEKLREILLPRLLKGEI